MSRVRVTDSDRFHNPSILITMTCILCNKQLKGKQMKFCSRTCKNRHSNRWHQSAQRQYIRGTNRKQKLVNIKGGKCMRCGYDECIHALSFHHRKPDEKSFSLDIRSCTNRSWNKLINELGKCDLLCLNCHMVVEWKRD